MKFSTSTHRKFTPAVELPALVKEGGESFWRRTRVIEFEHEVPLHERVDELDRKILEADWPHIHGWVVNGAVEVLKYGLAVPSEALDATKDYRDSEDGGTDVRGTAMPFEPALLHVSGPNF